MNASGDKAGEPDRDAPDTPPEDDEMRGEWGVDRRGFSAMFYVLSWGFANLVITFLGSLVLAGLLNPRDFGLIALGQTVATLGEHRGGGRYCERLHSPIAERSPARSCGLSTGSNCWSTAALAGSSTPIAAPVRSDRGVTALMVWALPLASPQMAGRVVLGRELRFRAIAVIEAMGVLAYYAWAIAGVLAGSVSGALPPAPWFERESRH